MIKLMNEIIKIRKGFFWWKMIFKDIEDIEVSEAYEVNVAA